MADAVDKEKSPGWAAEYFREEELRLKNQTWKSLLQPSVFGACLAIAGRIIFGPIAMLLLFTATNYLTDATVLIKPENSFLSFTEQDLSMAGGCTNCTSSCKISLLEFALFKEPALTSTPSFSALVGKPPTESLYDFSPLSVEALALAESLDQDGALCLSGIDDFGAISSLVTGSTEAVFNVIKVLNISISPLIERELELGIQRADECVTNWSMMGITRLFYYPSTLGRAQFG
ncbi:hypothetical protein PR003_g31727, partial [Phytophthora rubi]